MFFFIWDNSNMAHSISTHWDYWDHEPLKTALHWMSSIQFTISGHVCWHEPPPNKPFLRDKWKVKPRHFCFKCRWTWMMMLQPNKGPLSWCLAMNCSTWIHAATKVETLIGLVMMITISECMHSLFLMKFLFVFRVKGVSKAMWLQYGPCMIELKGVQMNSNEHFAWVKFGLAIPCRGFAENLTCQIFYELVCKIHTIWLTITL